MKVTFSTLFRRDFTEASESYKIISSRLQEDFDERVKATVRTIISWKGGDHVGPHGFPCRRCRPFPHLVYYQIEDESLYILGLVHEKRHPDYLKQNLP